MMGRRNMKLCILCWYSGETQYTFVRGGISMNEEYGERHARG